jgi:predicted DNA-binding antitoxin AbrB/MazE fold protein
MVSRVIRVRYEGGVFKPLEPVNLKEGEELLITILPSDEERRRVIEKYKGFMGRASKKELDELLLEAEFESF